MLRQASTFSQDYMEEVLARHAPIARRLVELPENASIRPAPGLLARRARRVRPSITRSMGSKASTKTASCAVS
jgi:hypothetical protein